MMTVHVVVAADGKSRTVSYSGTNEKGQTVKDKLGQKTNVNATRGSRGSQGAGCPHAVTACGVFLRRAWI